MVLNLKCSLKFSTLFSNHLGAPALLSLYNVVFWGCYVKPPYSGNGTELVMLSTERQLMAHFLLSEPAGYICFSFSIMSCIWGRAVFKGNLLIRAPTSYLNGTFQLIFYGLSSSNWSAINITLASARVI